MPTSSTAAVAFFTNHCLYFFLRFFNHFLDTCRMIRPSTINFSSAILATSLRIGSKLERITASGVSSMIRSTPVIVSSVRIFRPSLPMIRPFISSFGSCTTEIAVSATIRSTFPNCSNYIVLCLLVDFFLRLRFHFLDHLRSVNLHIFFHGL